MTASERIARMGLGGTMAILGIVLVSPVDEGIVAALTAGIGLAAAPVQGPVTAGIGLGLIGAGMAIGWEGVSGDKAFTRTMVETVKGIRHTI